MSYRLHEFSIWFVSIPGPHLSGIAPLLRIVEWDGFEVRLTRNSRLRLCWCRVDRSLACSICTQICTSEDLSGTLSRPIEWEWTRTSGDWRSGCSRMRLPWWDLSTSLQGKLKRVIWREVIWRILGWWSDWLCLWVNEQWEVRGIINSTVQEVWTIWQLWDGPNILPPLVANQVAAARCKLSKSFKWLPIRRRDSSGGKLSWVVLTLGV